MKPEHYNAIVRHLSGEASPEESERLKIWLTESPENQASFDRAERLWKKSAPLEPSSIPDVDASWLELAARITRKASPQTAHILPLRKGFLSRPRPLVRAFLTAAAAILLIVSWRVLMDDGWQSVATANGRMLKIELPDGSIVTLNHDSKIEFPEDFSELGRQVRLSGEAYFEVVKDSTTFSVMTENATIQVLGTKFNVWGRNQETRVVVYDGKVALKTEQEEVILQASERSYSLGNQRPAEVQTVDTDVYLNWMQGKLVFSKTSLRELADELQRKYDVRIQLFSPAIDTLTLTGSFHEQSIETVLKSICMTLDLIYFRNEGEYVIAKPQLETLFK